jgi:uncharacterized protein (TIGR02145 family)
VRYYVINTDGVTYGDVVEFNMPLGDIDGNMYEVRKVGDQFWTVENVRTTTYNDGMPMIDGTVSNDWVAADQAGAGAYCWLNNVASATFKFDDVDTYNNIPANRKTAYTHGRFYNAHAASNPKFAPAGWRVPTEDDYKELFVKIYGSDITNFGFTAGLTTWAPAIRDALCNWTHSNVTANNTWGFNGLVHGYRQNSGGWTGAWFQSGWWTSTHGILVFIRPATHCGIQANTPGTSYPIRLIKE